LARGLPRLASLGRVRIQKDLQKVIREWVSKQDDKPALATAVRRLVEIGLSNQRLKAAGLALSPEKTLRVMGNMADDLHTIGPKAKGK
jgi:hypothetical protein